MRCLDILGDASQAAIQVVPSVNWQEFTTRPIRGQRAIRKLGHRHVQNNVAFDPRHRDHQWIVSDSWLLRAPRGKIRTCVRPADSDEASIRGLPAVGPAAHPVVCVQGLA